MAERELAGCIHVHSRFSDGATPADQIIREAEAEGLDFLAFTDHDSAAVAEAGLTGWQGRLLCLCAPEIGLRGRPHFLAFLIGDPALLRPDQPEESLRRARELGAATFLAHPHPARIPMKRRRPAGWANVTADMPFDGLEVWSYMHDLCDRLTPWRLLRMPRGHSRLLRGPRRETLALWDRLCCTRRVAGISGLDNHAVRLPLLGQMLPHADLFRMQRTHVLVDELPADGAEAERALVRAMAEGSAFIAVDGWADAREFRLAARSSTADLGMGQESEFGGPGRWTLAVTSPQPADLRLLRAGRVVAEKWRDTGLEFQVVEPGAYRVEARLGRRPWVLTNPVYLWGDTRPSPGAGEA